MNTLKKVDIDFIDGSPSMTFSKVKEVDAIDSWVVIKTESDVYLFSSIAVKGLVVQPEY